MKSEIRKLEAENKKLKERIAELEKKELSKTKSTVLAKQEERIKASLQDQEAKIQEMIKSSGKTDPSQTKTDQSK